MEARENIAVPYRISSGHLEMQIPEDTEVDRETLLEEAFSSRGFVRHDGEHVGWSCVGNPLRSRQPETARDASDFHPVLQLETPDRFSGRWQRLKVLHFLELTRDVREQIVDALFDAGIQLLHRPIPISERELLFFYDGEDLVIPLFDDDRRVCVQNMLSLHGEEQGILYSVFAGPQGHYDTRKDTRDFPGTSVYLHRVFEFTTGERGDELRIFGFDDLPDEARMALLNTFLSVGVDLKEAAIDDDFSRQLREKQWGTAFDQETPATSKMDSFREDLERHVANLDEEKISGRPDADLLRNFRNSLSEMLCYGDMGKPKSASSMLRMMGDEIDEEVDY